jgi:hypothetical protein
MTQSTRQPLVQISGGGWWCGQQQLRGLVNSTGSLSIFTLLMPQFLCHEFLYFDSM